MTWLSWFYVVVLVLTLLTTIIIDLSVKIPARTRLVRTGLLLVVAIIAAVVTWRTATSTETQVLGWFVAGMCFLFACWRRGLASWAVIAGLSSVRVWGAISKVEIHPGNKAGRNEVWTYVGSIRVSRLVFNRDVRELQQFLANYLADQQVVVVQA
ncbi:hypothetical protein [Lacticaseibacillus thailandensis]|uniref:DUF5673 domain-containing protein n=1 Tax=Lacticaseibacillus thailandensis DSM 22698 = JCM 13996 TaxID=1423810 RepID=A0A0R2C902_9LACO|nr:hypothetical protein [Lacticaseibacillus thailandensis]KRM88335.1 hypothetical protein FD19_GL000629 [Lacticaseibacillus thailandensis DSM 22698 = JCM 13996]